MLTIRGKVSRSGYSETCLTSLWRGMGAAQGEELGLHIGRRSRSCVLHGCGDGPSNGYSTNTAFKRSPRVWRWTVHLLRRAAQRQVLEIGRGRALLSRVIHNFSSPQKLLGTEVSEIPGIRAVWIVRASVSLLPIVLKICYDK